MRRQLLARVSAEKSRALAKLVGVTVGKEQSWWSANFVGTKKTRLAAAGD
jgi:hypothetical protein